MTIMRTMRAASVSIALLALLAGCGPMPEATPTSTPAPATSTPGGDAATPDTSGTLGTPESPNQTFGDLADRVSAAWPDIDSYRVTFTGSALASSSGTGTPAARPMATPGATPMARPRDVYVTVREVDLPDRQRQMLTGLGSDDHEAIAIGTALYVRGPVVERIAPGTSPESWIEMDPTTLPEGAMLLHLLGGLPEPPGTPLATLPERLRAQTVREQEAIEQDGRQCRVYAAADTLPATGMRVDYTIAIDENDVLCFVETGAGGVTQGRDVYSDFNADFSIEPPAAATPVSIPADLATPIAHD